MIDIAYLIHRKWFNLKKRIIQTVWVRNYYVRMDGNDQNTGLNNTPKGAVRTIQRAMDISHTYDIRRFRWLPTRTIKINIAKGRYESATKRFRVTDAKTTIPFTSDEDAERSL
jgi:hypothetical protein